MSDEERVERAEAALAESLEERNRIWAELQERRSDERELTELRTQITAVEQSWWWRAGKPFRIAERLLADPGFALDVILARLRVFRARLNR